MAATINKDQVMPLLLEACPSFAQKLSEHRAFYEEELLYIELAEFARHLLELHRAGQTQEFPAVFDTIEQLHLDGDGYVREAATVGLLEAIQNNAEHEGGIAEEFVQYLKPETAEWWHKLNDFWDGNPRALMDSQ